MSLNEKFCRLVVTRGIIDAESLDRNEALRDRRIAIAGTTGRMAAVVVAIGSVLAATHTVPR